MATEVSRGRAPWLQSLASISRTRALWKWALLAIAAFYLGVVAVHFTAILANVELDADASSAQVTAELIASKGASIVYLGNMPWYSTLIFQLATKWLPAHREIWGAAPSAFGLLAVGLMAWAAARAADARAALVVAALLVCASPTMLDEMLWLNDHITSCYSLALIAALLMLLQTRSDTARPLTMVLVTIPAGLIVGVNLASDELLVAAPAAMLTASVVTWRVHPSPRTSRAVGWTIVTVITMCAGALATTAIMHAANIYPTPTRLAFATGTQVSENLRDWWESVAVLANGSFFGEALTLTAALSAICGLAAVAIVLLMPRLAWLDVAKRRGLSRPTDAPASAYLIFWSSSAVLLSAAFIFSDAPVGLGTTRYLTGLVFALAAVAPVLARRSASARAGVIVVALVFAVTSTKALLDSSLIKEPTRGPTAAVAEAVASVAEQQGAAQGYAMYWDAAPLTWNSHLRVQAHPVYVCSGGLLCSGPVNAFTGWYGAGGPEHTFLVTDTSEPYTPTAELGPIAATYHIGTLTMYVFDHDIGRFIH
jgi:hypothetical protein